MGLERVKSTAELSGPLRQVGARMLDAHFAKWAKVPHTEGTTVAMYFWSAGFWIGREGLARGSDPPKRDGRWSGASSPEVQAPRVGDQPLDRGHRAGSR